MFLVSVWAVLLTDCTYRCLMESSARQATLGQSAVRIHVTDTNGMRLTPGRAFARYCLQIVNYLSLGAGYIAIALTKKKQGFHDMIARTYVLRDPLPIKNRPNSNPIPAPIAENTTPKLPTRDQ